MHDLSNELATVPFTALAEAIQMNIFIDAYHFMYDAFNDPNNELKDEFTFIYEFESAEARYQSIAYARQPCDPISFDNGEEELYDTQSINNLLDGLSPPIELNHNSNYINYQTSLDYLLHKQKFKYNYCKLRKIEVNAFGTDIAITTPMGVVSMTPDELDKTSVLQIVTNIQSKVRQLIQHDETVLPQSNFNFSNQFIQRISDKNEQKGLKVNLIGSKLYPNATNKHDPGPRTYKPVRGFNNPVQTISPTPPYVVELPVEPVSTDEDIWYGSDPGKTGYTPEITGDYTDDDDYIPESNYGSSSNICNPGEFMYFDFKSKQNNDSTDDDESDIDLGDRLLGQQSRLARISSIAAEVNINTTDENKEPQTLSTDTVATRNQSPSETSHLNNIKHNIGLINYNSNTIGRANELVNSNGDVFINMNDMTNDEYKQYTHNNYLNYIDNIPIQRTRSRLLPSKRLNVPLNGTLRPRFSNNQDQSVHITNDDVSNYFSIVENTPPPNISKDEYNRDIRNLHHSIINNSNSSYDTSEPEESSDSLLMSLDSSTEFGLRIQAEQDAENYGYDSDRTDPDMPGLTATPPPTPPPNVSPPPMWRDDTPDEAIFNDDEDVIFIKNINLFNKLSYIDTNLLFDKLEIGKGKQFISGASGYPPTRQLQNCIGVCRAGYVHDNIVEVESIIGTDNWYQNETLQIFTIQAPHETLLSQSEQLELKSVRYAQYANHSKAYEAFNQNKIQTIQPQKRRWWIKVPIILKNGNVIKVFMMADTGANHPCVNTRWALTNFKNYIENISKHDKLVLNTASTQVQPKHALYLLFPTPSGIFLKAKFYLLDNLPVNILADINMLIKFGYKFKHEQPKVFTHNEEPDQNLHIKNFEESHKIHTRTLESMENLQETPIKSESNKNNLNVASSSNYKKPDFYSKKQQSKTHDESINTNKPINILCTTLQDYEKHKLNMDLYTKDYQVNYINDDLSIAQNIWVPQADGETDDLLYIYGISNKPSENEKGVYIRHNLGEYARYFPTPSNSFDTTTKVWTSITPINQSYNEQFDDNNSNKHHLIDTITNKSINQAIEELNQLNNFLQQNPNDSDSDDSSVDIKMSNSGVCQLNQKDHSYDQMYNAVTNISEYRNTTANNINVVSSNSINSTLSGSSSTTTNNNTLFNRFINVVKQNKNKTTFNQLQMFMYSINFIMMKESFKATPEELQAADKLESNKVLKMTNFDYIKEVEKIHPRFVGLHAGTEKLVKEFDDVFAKFTYDRRTMYVEDARLGIKDEFRHITCFRAQYPLSVQKRLWMIEYTRQNDKNEYWAEVPQTLHCIPYLMIPKRNKEGKIIRYRPAFDARVVNQYLDLYPIHLPTMHDFDEIYSVKGLFTLMDMKNMFDCIPLHKDDQPWSTVMTPLGLRRMTHLAYGFKNCPYFAQNIMNKMAMSIGLTLIYIDDIVMKHHWHWDAKQHLEHLRKALQYCRDKNMLLNPSKFFPFVTKCTSFGFERTLHGSSISEAYKQKIIQAEQPTTVKEMKSFLGLIGYIARYLYNGALIQYWLHQLTIGLDKQLKGRIKWTQQAEVAFKQIKYLAKNAPVLTNPTLDGEFMIKTDACITGIGAVLYQKQKISDKSDEISEESDEKSDETNEESDKKYKWVIIDMYSKQMPQDYRKSHSSVHEALAVVNAFQHWQHYLIKRKFIIYTDNRPVSCVFTENYEGLNPITQSQLVRLRIALTPFTFEIKHVPGVENTLADALSRETIRIIKELKINNKIAQSNNSDKLTRLISTSDNWISFGKVIHSPDTPYKPQTPEQKQEIEDLAQKYGKDKEIVELLQLQHKQATILANQTNIQLNNHDYTHITELLINLELKNKQVNESLKTHIPDNHQFIQRHMESCFINQVQHWQKYQPFPLQQQLQSQPTKPPFGIMVNDELDQPLKINKLIQSELTNCCNIAKDISLPVLLNVAQQQEDMYDKLNHQTMQVLFSKSKGEKLGNSNRQKKKRTIDYMANNFKQNTLNVKTNKKQNFTAKVSDIIINKNKQNMVKSKSIAQQYKEQIQKDTRRKKIVISQVMHAMEKFENKLEQNLPTKVQTEQIQSNSQYINDYKKATSRTAKSNRHLKQFQTRMITTLDDDEREYYSNSSEEYLPPTTKRKRKSKRKTKSKSHKNIKMKLRSDSRKQFNQKAKRTDYLGEDFDELCDKRAVRQEFTHNLFGYRDKTIFDEKLFIQRQKSDTLLNLVRCIISLCNNKDCPITRDNIELYDYNKNDQNTKLTAQQQETNAIIEDFEYVQSQNADLAIGIIDGTLYLNPQTDILTKKVTINKQIKYARVVPGVLKHKLLDYAHHNLQSHHTNWKQSYQNLEGDYWWTTMKQDMRRFVLRCLLCQFANGSLKNRAPLNVRQPVLPRESIFGDFIELVLANHRFYILVLVDYCTGWTMLIPTKTNDAYTVVDALLRKWIPLFGMFKYFDSDQGSGFISRVLKLLLIGINADLQLAEPGYHRGIGKVERTIKIIQDNFQRINMQWDEVITDSDSPNKVFTILRTISPHIQAALNQRRPRISTYSPNMLMFGTQLKDISNIEIVINRMRSVFCEPIKNSSYSSSTDSQTKQKVTRNKQQPRMRKKNNSKNEIDSITTTDVQTNKNNNNNPIQKRGKWFERKKKSQMKLQERKIKTKAPIDYKFEDFEYLQKLLDRFRVIYDAYKSDWQKYTYQTKASYEKRYNINENTINRNNKLFVVGTKVLYFVGDKQIANKKWLRRFTGPWTIVVKLTDGTVIIGDDNTRIQKRVSINRLKIFKNNEMKQYHQEFDDEEYKQYNKELQDILFRTDDKDTRQQAKTRGIELDFQKSRQNNSTVTSKPAKIDSKNISQRNKNNKIKIKK